MNIRVFQDLVAALWHAEDHGLNIGADVEVGGTDQVVERSNDHWRVEVTGASGADLYLFSKTLEIHAERREGKSIISIVQCKFDCLLHCQRVAL